MAIERDDMELQTFYDIVRIALEVLSRRVLHLLTVLLSAFLFGWVMYNPDTLRLGGAVAFTILMIVLTWIGGKNAVGNTS